MKSKAEMQKKYLTKLKELRAKHHNTEKVKHLNQVIKRKDAVIKKFKIKLVYENVHQELITNETELAARGVQEAADKQCKSTD